AAPQFTPVEPPVSTRTDASGQFRLAVTSTGWHTVRVEAAGLASRTLPHVRPGEALRIALDKGGSIEGIGRDGTTGAPAAAITLDARLETSRGIGMVWERGAGLVRAVSDEQGRFHLDGLAPGLYTIAARAPESSAVKRGVGVGKRAELYL